MKWCHLQNSAAKHGLRDHLLAVQSAKPEFHAVANPSSGGLFLPLHADAVAKWNIDPAVPSRPMASVIDATAVSLATLRTIALAIVHGISAVFCRIANSPMSVTVSVVPAIFPFTVIPNQTIRTGRNRYRAPWPKRCSSIPVPSSIASAVVPSA